MTMQIVASARAAGIPITTHIKYDFNIASVRRMRLNCLLWPQLTWRARDCLTRIRETNICIASATLAQMKGSVLARARRGQRAAANQPRTTRRWVGRERSLTTSSKTNARWHSSAHTYTLMHTGGITQFMARDAPRINHYARPLTPIITESVRVCLWFSVQLVWIDQMMSGCGNAMRSRHRQR